MEKNKFIFLLLIFIAGMAVGMIIAGTYDKYEFETANNNLFEQLKSCQEEQQQIPAWTRKLNFTVNLT